MAEKRMFSKVITESDAFQDMPLSTQALYFHLGMCADDDGFVNSPRKIQRMIGASDDDMKILIGKRFILIFESGIVVIKHWKINNTIRTDRYKETTYLEEKRLLFIDEKGAYTDNPNKAIKPLDTIGIPNGYQMETQYRLDKIRLDKISIEKENLKEKDLIENVESIMHRCLTPKELDICKEWKDISVLEKLQDTIAKGIKYPIAYTDKLLKDEIQSNESGSKWLDEFMERNK